MRLTFHDTRPRATGPGLAGPGWSARVLRGVGWLCVLLVLVAGAAHLLHTHPDSDTASASCSLCAVAHMDSLVAPAPVVGATLAAVAPAPVAQAALELPAGRRARHTIRPPPTR